jgi:deferrochelatase/peroxidase EfeB
MAAGDTALPLATDPSVPAGDSGDVLGLTPSRLTVTFGFGASLFGKDGADRYGLAARRPDALVDMPAFNGDQLVEGQTGGDLSIQACADDAQVAFHAVRQLVRLAYGTAQLRWVQSGFLPAYPVGETPRNLMGFKDGTINPKPPFAAVWVTDDGPAPGAQQGDNVTRVLRRQIERREVAVALRRGDDPALVLTPERLDVRLLRGLRDTRNGGGRQHAARRGEQAAARGERTPSGQCASTSMLTSSST